MSATERPSLLNDMEALSLELKRTKPVAMTLVALEAYASSVDMPEADVERHADVIRQMEPAKLKRLRKSLNAAAELSELLDITPQADDVTDEPVARTEPIESTRTDSVEVPSTESVIEELIVPNDESAKDFAEAADTDISHEMSVSDLSEAGKKWVLRLIPDYDFEDMTAIKVANDLYRRSGEPQTRTFGGKKIDPKLRIRRRLRGMNHAEIASTEGSTASAVSSWFSNSIDSRIKSKVVDSMPGEAAEVESVASETEAIPETTIVESEAPQPEPEQVFPEPLVASPATVRFRAPTPEAASDVIDTAPFAKFWAQEMKLDDEDAEFLAEVLNPSYSFDLTGSHRAKLHHFRQFMQDRLPILEDSDLDLTSNEVARLSKLLGRVEEKGEYSFTAKPRSARELSMEDGYMVPQYREELLNGLEKIYTYMQQTKSLESEPNVVSQFKEVLRHAGFTDTQIIGLESAIGLRDVEGVDPSVINDALRVLQVLFVEKSSKFDPEDDKDVQASLRMITNTAMGRKTVNDVYHRLHGKDNSVTRQSVIQMLESGIIKLAM